MTLVVWIKRSGVSPVFVGEMPLRGRELIGFDHRWSDGAAAFRSIGL
jgi:hypothetical protein